MGGGPQRIRVAEVVGNGEGGGTKCVARIVRYLDPAQFEMTVVAPESRLLEQVCSERDARFVRLPLSQSRLRPGGYRQLAALLRDLRPDIVSAHGTRAAWYAQRALRATTITPRVMYSEHLFSFDGRRGLMRLPWLALERYLCRHADALATSCAANARHAEASGWIDPQRIVMRHYGIELEEFRWQAANKLSRAELDLPENAMVVGTVARFVAHKGLRYLLEAAAQVLRTQRNVVFLIVGDGELRADLEAQCRSLNIADNVRFLGAHAKPWRILANADVIAFSSLFEGLPQTCIEALAVGSAVVATRLNGTAELITSGYNGLLVPTHDAHALAEGIRTLLSNPEMRRGFGQHGPEAVQDFRTEWMVARFENTYRWLYAQPVTTVTRVAIPARVQ